MTSGHGLAELRAAARFILTAPFALRRLRGPGSGIVPAGLCLCLAACADFPEVATMDGAAGPPPTLQPLDGLLPDAEITTDPAPALGARAAALRSRASAIGAP
jgi:hypothetical protein